MFCSGLDINEEVSRGKKHLLSSCQVALLNRNENFNKFSKTLANIVERVVIQRDNIGVERSKKS